MKGYVIEAGYMGYVDGAYMLFMGKMRARSRSALMSITQSIMRQTRWELSIIPTTSNGWKRQGWI